ncbi:MAG: diacylglycerol kinase [Gammaproteobacteria bacterium]|nr:diacylglycerol kinase [Gammaproteobacteria bacterium]
MIPQRTGFTRVVYAAKYSWQGFRAAFKTEAAFRQELFFAVILIPAAFWVGNNAVEVSLLIASVLLLLIVELINTAIEAVVDRFGEEWHELSGVAKDVGSAAVMLAIILIFTVWGLIAWENYF